MSDGRREYGLMAEFATAGELVAAAREARKAGYRRVDAYSPFPIEEVCEELVCLSIRLRPDEKADWQRLLYVFTDRSHRVKLYPRVLCQTVVWTNVCE